MQTPASSLKPETKQKRKRLLNGRYVIIFDASLSTKKILKFDLNFSHMRQVIEYRQFIIVKSGP
jgi:hypothetical protein